MEFCFAPHPCLEISPITDVPTQSSSGRKGYHRMFTTPREQYHPPPPGHSKSRLSCETRCVMNAPPPHTPLASRFERAYPRGRLWTSPPNFIHPRFTWQSHAYVFNRRHDPPASRSHSIPSPSDSDTLLANEESDFLTSQSPKRRILNSCVDLYAYGMYALGLGW